MSVMMTVMMMTVMMIVCPYHLMSAYILIALSLPISHGSMYRRLERELRKDREEYLQVIDEDDLNTAHKEAMEAAEDGEVSLAV